MLSDLFFSREKYKVEATKWNLSEVKYSRIKHAFFPFNESKISTVLVKIVTNKQFHVFFQSFELKTEVDSLSGKW